MLKKYSILFILFIAYGIVMAHSIVPHHHDEDHETAQAMHHPHDDDHGDGSPLNHDFENYLHGSDAANVHQQPESGIVFTTTYVCLLTSFFDLTLNAVENPPPLLRQFSDYIPVSQHCLSAKGLRAPPSSLM